MNQHKSEYWNQRVALTQSVKVWFAESRYKAPSLEQCSFFAGYMLVVQTAEQKTKVKPAAPDRAAAAKHGRIFVRHLVAVRRDIEKMLPDDSKEDDPYYLGPSRETAIEMRRVEECVEAIVASLRKRDPIHFLAQKACEAWATANNGKHPSKQPKPDAPLCVFLKNALNAIGINVSNDTISMTLKGKRRIGSG